MRHQSNQQGNTLQPPVTTTDAGIPAPSDEFSLTVGPTGPVLLQDNHLIEKMAQFNRERVPERVVHVKGAGAFGYFEVAAAVRHWTKATFLNGVGKRSPMLIRFSTVAGEQGYADSDRDHLVSNLVDHLGQDVSRTIQERFVRDYWARVDATLAARVDRGLGLRLEVGAEAPQLSGKVGNPRRPLDSSVVNLSGSLVPALERENIVCCAVDNAVAVGPV